MHMEVRHRLLSIFAARMEKIDAGCTDARPVMHGQHLNHANHAREKMWIQVPKSLVVCPGSHQGVAVRFKVKWHEGHNLVVLLHQVLLALFARYRTERAAFSLHNSIV